MKCLVKPKTSTLFLLDRGEVVEALRPSLVTVTAVVNSKLAAGDWLLLGAAVPDTATDAEFLEHWRACREDGKVDEAFAVSSFMSRFAPTEGGDTKKEAPTEGGDTKKEAPGGDEGDAEKDDPHENVTTPRSGSKKHGR